MRAFLWVQQITNGIRECESQQAFPLPDKEGVKKLLQDKEVGQGYRAGTGSEGQLGRELPKLYSDTFSRVYDPYLQMIAW